MNNNLENILKVTLCHSAGIVPLETLNHDVNRILEGLPPDEARRMRRKFRKLWRKAFQRDAVAMGKTEKSKGRMKRMYGVGEESPSKNQRLARKVKVNSMMIMKTRELLKNSQP